MYLNAICRVQTRSAIVASIGGHNRFWYWSREPDNTSTLFMTKANLF